jgi:MFS family permease
MRGTPYRAVCVLTVLGFGGYALLLPVVPLWVAGGGAGAFGAGVSTGVLMLVTVLTQLGVPWLLRRIGYRWVLGVGLVLLGAPAPALVLSAELAPVLALSAVRGVGFGLLTVAGSALVAELVPTAELGRASAVYGLAIGVPQLLLLPAGVGVAQRFGFGPVLLAGAVPLLGVALLPLIRVARPARAAPRPAVATPPTEDEPGGIGVPGGRVDGQSAPPGSARGAPASLRARAGPLLAMLACSTAQGGLVTFLPLAAHPAGWPVPAALFGTAAGALLGRVLAGELSDRRGWGGRLVWPGVGLGLLGMLAEVAAVWGSGWPAPVLVPGGALLVGVGFGLVQNDSLVVLLAAAGPARYGGASALWNIAYDAGTGVGAVGLGAVAQGFGYRAAFGAAAAALALTLPVVPRRRPDPRRGPPPGGPPR